MAKRGRKRKLKPIEPLPHIDGDFQVAAFDLSLARPGFAILQYHADTRTVELIKKDIIRNKYSAKQKKRGQILHEIGKLFTEYISPQAVKAVVREKGFVRFNTETAALYCVTGAVEMILWDRKEMWFQEYPPLTVKKTVTGSGKSTKEEVALAIDNYLLHAAWCSDDESDAVAVGLTFLILNGYIDPIPIKGENDAEEAE